MAKNNQLQTELRKLYDCYPDAELTKSPKTVMQVCSERIHQWNSSESNEKCEESLLSMFTHMNDCHWCERGECTGSPLNCLGLLQSCIVKVDAKIFVVVFYRVLHKLQQYFQSSEPKSLICLILDRLYDLYELESITDIDQANLDLFNQLSSENKYGTEIALRAWIILVRFKSYKKDAKKKVISYLNTINDLRELDKETAKNMNLIFKCYRDKMRRLVFLRSLHMKTQEPNMHISQFDLLIIEAMEKFANESHYFFEVIITKWRDIFSERWEKLLLKKLSTKEPLNKEDSMILDCFIVCMRNMNVFDVFSFYRQFCKETLWCVQGGSDKFKQLFVTVLGRLNSHLIHETDISFCKPLLTASLEEQFQYAPRQQQNGTGEEREEGGEVDAVSGYDDQIVSLLASLLLIIGSDKVTAVEFFDELCKEGTFKEEDIKILKKRFQSPQQHDTEVIVQLLTELNENMHTQMKEINQTLKTLKDSISLMRRNSTIDINNVTTQIATLREDVTTQIATNIHTQMEEINQTLKTLKDSISSMQRNSTSDINNVTTQIATVGENVTTQIATLREDVTTQIATVGEDVTTQIATVGERIANATDEINENTNANCQRIRKNSEGESKKLDKIDNNVIRIQENTDHVPGKVPDSEDQHCSKAEEAGE